MLVREPDDDGQAFWLEHWQDEEIGPVGTMLSMIGALTANNTANPQAIADKALFGAKVDIGGYLATTQASGDLDLAASAFDYLEAGNSVVDTLDYIDQQLGVLGQAHVAAGDDLFL